MVVSSRLPTMTLTLDEHSIFDAAEQVVLFVEQIPDPWTLLWRKSKSRSMSQKTGNFLFVCSLHHEQLTLVGATFSYFEIINRLEAAPPECGSKNRDLVIVRMLDL